MGTGVTTVGVAARAGAGRHMEKEQNPPKQAQEPVVDASKQVRHGWRCLRAMVESWLLR